MVDILYPFYNFQYAGNVRVKYDEVTWKYKLTKAFMLMRFGWTCKHNWITVDGIGGIYSCISFWYSPYNFSLAYLHCIGCWACSCEMVQCWYAIINFSNFECSQMSGLSSYMKWMCWRVFIIGTTCNFYRPTIAP